MKDEQNMIFLAPDNGVLTGVLEPGDPVSEVSNRELFLSERVSNTFHGRDIFSPVAARIAAGLDVSEVGPEVTDPVRLDLPEPTELSGGGLGGAIVHIDRFGNLISNIREQDLLALDEERRKVCFRGAELPEFTAISRKPKESTIARGMPGRASA